MNHLANMLYSPQTPPSIYDLDHTQYCIVSNPKAVCRDDIREVERVLDKKYPVDSPLNETRQNSLGLAARFNKVSMMKVDSLVSDPPRSISQPYRLQRLVTPVPRSQL